MMSKGLVKHRLHVWWSHGLENINNWAAPTPRSSPPPHRQFNIRLYAPKIVCMARPWPRGRGSGVIITRDSGSVGNLRSGDRRCHGTDTLTLIIDSNLNFLKTQLHLL